MERLLEKSTSIENLPLKVSRIIHSFAFSLILFYIIDPYHAIFVTNVLPSDMKNVVSLVLIGFFMCYTVYGALSLLALIGAVYI